MRRECSEERSKEGGGSTKNGCWRGKGRAEWRGTMEGEERGRGKREWHVKAQHTYRLLTRHKACVKKLTSNTVLFAYNNTLDGKM